MTFAELKKILVNNNVFYAVAWGYEKLPKTSGGDLDLYVHRTDYNIMKQLLINDGWKHTPCIYSSNTHLHDYFNKNRFTIDMFNTLCFSLNGKPYQFNISFLPVRQYKNNVFVSNQLELLCNLIRFYGGRHDMQIIERINKYLEPLT